MIGRHDRSLRRAGGPLGAWLRSTRSSLQRTRIAISFCAKGSPPFRRGSRLMLRPSRLLILRLGLRLERQQRQEMAGPSRRIFPDPAGMARPPGRKPADFPARALEKKLRVADKTQLSV